VHALLEHDLVDELHLLLYPRHARKRQTSSAKRAAPGIHPDIDDALSKRCRRPALRSSVVRTHMAGARLMGGVVTTAADAARRRDRVSRHRGTAGIHTRVQQSQFPGFARRCFRNAHTTPVAADR
jgi:hypothetical protein